MTNRQRQHVLINGSNLHVGGGVAVATSYIKSLSLKKTLEFDISLLVSTKIMKNLKDLDTDFSVFKSVKSIDYVGIKALWSGLAKELSDYDLVFTVFGPAYTMRKPAKHIVGFAQPSIIYPDSRAFLKIPVHLRKVQRLKFKMQELFFAKADALVVELEHVKLGLQKIPAFRDKKIYVVNSAVDSVFSEPDRWLAIDTPMGSDRRIKLGLISRNYAHKNLDLLPYIKQTLKEKHAIEADLFVTFVPEEWDTCSDFFKEKGKFYLPNVNHAMQSLYEYLLSMKASRITVEAKIYEIISYLASYLKENRLNEENGQPINKTDLQALDELTHYMDEHYSFNITLQTLSTIACMSESKMKKLFKSVYNMSITEYIQRKRISAAEHMLIQTDLTIAEISRIVGYSNPSRLIEIFKRYYGFTPSKYRK